MGFPVDDDRIVAAERTLGRRFPAALRSRLARSNGGEIATADDYWTLNPVRDDSDRKRLSRSMYDVVRETESARQWHSSPSGGIAIASNGSGDLLILMPDSEDIFDWSHETGEIRPVDVEWR